MGRFEFADGFFDLVVSHQVFEHVAEVEPALAEIRRVLKPGGAMLALFPSREALREGHIGISCAHWFRQRSRLRYGYVAALRLAGLGSHKDRYPSVREWTTHYIEWMGRYTNYRSRREILAAFSRHFEVESVEDQYMAFRIRHRLGGRAVPWLTEWSLPRGLQRVCRRLSGLVLLAVRPVGPPTRLASREDGFPA